jgi:hypothetical protein
MKGWRTIGINAILAGSVSSLEFLLEVDWTSIVDPSIAIVIIAIVNLGLRLVTTSAVGKK